MSKHTPESAAWEIESWLRMDGYNPSAIGYNHRLTRYPESVQHARDHDGKTDGNGHVRFYRVRPLIYAGTLAEREAEHLQDMLHCQERVVNLLMAARIMCDAFAVPDDGSGDDDVEVYFREPLKILREAIRKEEKENGNDNK